MSDNMGDIKLGTLMAEVDLDTSGLEKGVERAEKAYGSLTKEIKKSTDAVGDFAKSIGKLDDKTGDTIGGIGDIITKVSEYRKEMLAAEAAGTAFSSGLGLLGIGIAGVSFVYNAIKYAVDEYNARQQELIHNAGQAATAIAEENETISEQLARVQFLKEKLANGGLSFSDQKDARMELLSIQNEWLDKLDIEAQKVNILSDDYSMLQDSIMSAFAEKGEESFAQNYNGYLSASQKVNKKDSYILNTGYYNSPEFDQLLEENGFFHYNDMMTGVPALSVMIEDVTQEELIQKYSNISNQLDSIDSLSAEEKKNIRKELSAQLTKYNTEDFQEAQETVKKYSELSAKYTQSDLYNTLQDAKGLLSQAESSGDEADYATAQTQFKKLQEQWLATVDSITDDSVKDYFFEQIEFLNTGLSQASNSLYQMKNSGKITQETYESATVSLRNYTEELQRSMTDVGEASDYISQCLDKVNRNESLSEEEKNRLIKLYPKLKNSVIQTANGWTIEKTALEAAHKSVYGLQTAYVAAQTTMSTAVKSGALQRLGIMQSEVEGLSSMADAYAQISRNRQKYAVGHGTTNELSAKGYFDVDGSSQFSIDETVYLAAAEAVVQLKQLKNELQGFDASVLSEGTSTSSKTEAASGVQQDAQKTEEALKEMVGNIDNAYGSLQKALKEKYKDIYDTQKELIQQSIEGWKEWADKSTEAIQAQIDALDELEKKEEDENKVAELKRKRDEIEYQLRFETDDYNRKQLQKSLNEAEKNLDDEIKAQEREQLKEDLRAQIEQIRQISEEKQNSLSEQMNALDEAYQKQTEDAVIKTEAKKMILDKQQNEIIGLLKQYEPDYFDLGKSFGEQLIEGLGQTKVGKIVSQIQAYGQNTLDTIARIASGQIESYHLTAAGNIAAPTANEVNVICNFYEKTDSPSEIKRNMDHVADYIASVLK